MRQFIFIRYCKTILLPGIIIGLFIISSCSDSPKSTYIYSHSNIIYSQATDEPFTGRIIDTVANRIIKYDVKNGLKDGEFVIYFLNGKKEICGKVKENKNEGKWSYYYPDGKLESQGYFKNDKPTNKWIWYYSNGEKKEEGNFLEGKREGIWKTYRENGTLKSSVYFNKEGNVVNTLESKISAS
jgi:antitoxin component YwqK of YwqJK toxin-antitoxin module